MTTTTYLAYALIGCYFVIERSLRKDQQSLMLKPGVEDAGSSPALWLSGVVNLVIFISAPVLNAHQIGYWQSSSAGWFGVVLMASGLVIRYWAAKTLGRFYTRTLQVSESQQLVSRAPYNVIRHPGYLGTLLIVLGAGLSVTNWAVLLAGAVIGMLSRTYRISAEEKLMKDKFDEEYQNYAERTWRLIPFLY